MPTFLAPVAITASAAQSGSLRYATNTGPAWRNAAGTGDGASLFLDPSDSLTYNATNWHRFISNSVEVLTVRPTQMLSTIPWSTTGSFIAVGTNPAQAGAFRAPNNSGLYFRNAANTLDQNVLNMGSDNIVRISWAVSASVQMHTNGSSVATLAMDDTTLTIGEAKNVVLGTTTGTTWGTSATQKQGWWGAAGVVQNTGWSVTAGYTSTKSFNPETASLLTSNRVLGTLIDILKSYGFLG